MTRQYAPRNAEKGPKGKFVTIALDERTRFAVELAARKERRTVSNLIGEAIQKYLPTLEYTEGNVKTPFMEVVDEIWSPLESSRLAFLADRLPNHLTFDEQIIWHLIQRDDSLWRLGPRGEELSRDGMVKNKLHISRLYDKWNELKGKAKEIAAKELAENYGHSSREDRVNAAVPKSIISNEMDGE